jgi:predicted Zn-dependent peptidase
MARGCGPVVVLLTLAVASHARATTRPAPFEPPVQRIVLPNGLTVLLAADHKAPLVGMQLRYRVGTRDEPESRPGLAGLVQRLMMRATMHLAEGDYDRYLDAAGGFDAGWLTSLDQSTAWVTIPSEALALPLWLWSDQMGFFATRVDDRLIAQQLQVARNERVQRHENRPAGRVSELTAAELYPPGHPYRGGALRNPGGLAGLTASELRAFVESHYTPDHALLVLAGDFDPQRARVFGSLRRAPTTERRYGSIAPLPGEVRLQVAARVELPSVVITWRTPPTYGPGDAELDLIAELLVGPRAGWLRWKLVDDWKIAATVTAHQHSHELGSEFAIEATASRGHTARELVDGIDRVLRSLQSGPVDGYSMRGAIAGFVVAQLFATERRLPRINVLVECEQRSIQTHCLDAWVSRYLSIDPGGLSAVATRELPLDRRVVVEVTPAPDAPIAGELRARSGASR